MKLRKATLAALVTLPALYHLHETAIAETAVSDHVIDEGVSQPVFSYEDAIRETIYVETDLDTDGDGKNDRIAADIIRPAESEEGLEVPVIMVASPYNENMGRGEESQLKEYIDGKPVSFPLFYDNYFVPRGYAVVHVDMIGTSLSDGCPTTGGYEETESVTAVIDWLNDNADGYDIHDETAVADWSTGKVGMYGKSYDGTLANAAAATNVEGLETIIPVTAISSWYDYYRANGSIYYLNGPNGLANRVVNSERRGACQFVFNGMRDLMDDEFGDYNEFWEERNYVPDADNVTASVFLIHGLNDLNVKTNHFGQWWEQLEEHDVDRKIWLAQTAHAEPFDYRRDEWVSTVHRWFDHELLGIDNGIMDEPMADVEHAANEWTTYDSWPESSTEDVKLTIGQGDEHGHLTDVPVPSGEELSFRNLPLTERQLAEDPLADHDHRLAFLSPELEEEVRISGTPEIELTASVNGERVNLSALIVDYGTDERLDHRSGSSGMQMIDEQTCWGESSEHDSACYYEHDLLTHVQDYEIVSRGWMDARNYESVWESQSLVPGETYSFSWNTMTHDYVFKPGHRIGVIISGSNRTHTRAEHSDVEVTVDLSESLISLPVVGGSDSIDFGLSVESLIEQVEQFNLEGAFSNERSVRQLLTHLTAVKHFEKREDRERAVQHLGSFHHLLQGQLNNGVINEQTYDDLIAHTNALQYKWE
ncbi:Xaa-Pro dipeptidyl-peptidase [Geomicrobium sp. JSM 1781026]|uniref:Xaa-Pro dipeptidyl-peptidase n=1 Tax=Geomicrobium sp. JSM 1781026 TaxID=3344580 RepID=UPI0035BEEA52